jgi:serine/threonine-protein kinase RsbW
VNPGELVGAAGSGVSTRLAVTVTPTVLTPRTVARSVAAVVAARVGDHRHDDVLLAVHELVVNAIDHGGGGPLTVRVVEAATCTYVEVVDDGVGGVSAPAPVTRADGPLGRGLLLVRASADALEASTTPDGHAVRVTYHLDGRRGRAV